jgi:endoglucanase
VAAAKFHALPLILFLALYAPWLAQAAELLEASPLTDCILMLHFNEGHVIHHERGQSRSDEKVIISPLETEAASRTSTYAIRSPDDERYANARATTQVGRKSKGTDFAWFTDQWVDGHAVNARPDHTKEHWIYLFLPEPMKSGKTYLIQTASLASNGSEWKLAFDETKARSEAVHVNLLGCVPSAARR